MLHAGLEDSKIQLSREKLEETFKSLDLDHFAEKTGIIRKLTCHSYDPAGICMLMQLARIDYLRSEIPQVAKMTFLMWPISELVQKILVDYPAEFNWLKEKGFLEL